MSMDLIQNSNKAVINAADLGASQTSEVVELKEATGYAAQIYWSGGTATAGDVIVEATNDEPSASAIYTQISTDAVSTTSGSLMKNNAGAMYSYVRVRWVRSAGSGGSITCKVSVKR
jgi:hypothetical protein